MWRTLFLAVGVYLLILGLQCLGVEKFVLNVREPGQQAQSLGNEEPRPGSKRKIVPAPWAPWSLLSTGAVVCLYSFSIPRRVHISRK